jgi:hypothetical protein
MDGLYYIMNEIQLKLAGSSTGRIILHLIAAVRDHKWDWHLAGIKRELV